MPQCKSGIPACSPSPGRPLVLPINWLGSNLLWTGSRLQEGRQVGRTEAHARFQNHCHAGPRLVSIITGIAVAVAGQTPHRAVSRVSLLANPGRPLGHFQTQRVLVLGLGWSGRCTPAAASVGCHWQRQPALPHILACMCCSKANGEARPFDRTGGGIPWVKARPLLAAVGLA